MGVSSNQQGAGTNFETLQELYQNYILNVAGPQKWQGDSVAYYLVCPLSVNNRIFIESGLFPYARSAVVTTLKYYYLDFP